MDPITCERCYMVSGGGVPSAKPWLIRDSQLEQEGNMVFLKLERKDTALGRLITGHSRSNPLRDYNFLISLSASATSSKFGPREPCRRLMAMSRSWL